MLELNIEKNRLKAAIRNIKKPTEDEQEAFIAVARAPFIY